jgi:GntP family gluconate:H+ symporter
MPLLHALYLLAAIVLTLLLAQRRRIVACIALGLAAMAFGFASGQSVSLIGKAFGEGFGQFITAPGLVIIAAALISALGHMPGGGLRRARWPATAIGLVAGLAGSVSMAYAILTPLRDAVTGRGRAGRIAALGLGLALSASHGLLLPSPLAIGTSAILGARWQLMLAFGIPAALIAILTGSLYARRVGPKDDSIAPASSVSIVPPRLEFGLVLAVIAPLALLILRSVGDYPTEPLGGGPARELILGLGRAPILALVGLGIMVAFTWGRVAGFWAAQGSAARVLGAVAPLVLVVGASGGMQRLLQETGMAENLAGQLLGWRAGLLVPFLAAAIIKALQGSSLVAMLTAAGMVQPLLGPLGLDSDTGRALAALAVGAGATSLRHIADPLFWQIGDAAETGPGRTLVAVTGGTLSQGLASLAALIVLGTIFG